MIHYFFCHSLLLVVIILNILQSLPTTYSFDTGIGFSPILEDPSARTNSPSKAPIPFSDWNTSSTVDPGFIKITSRSACLESFFALGEYILF